MTKWRGDIIQEFIEELSLRSALPIINTVRASDVYFTMLYVIHVCGNDLLLASTFDWFEETDYSNRKPVLLLAFVSSWWLSSKWIILKFQLFLRLLFIFRMVFVCLATIGSHFRYETLKAVFCSFYSFSLAQFDRFIMQLLEMTWRFVIFATRFSSDHHQFVRV